MAGEQNEFSHDRLLSPDEGCSFGAVVNKEFVPLLSEVRAELLRRCWNLPIGLSSSAINYLVNEVFFWRLYRVMGRVFLIWSSGSFRSKNASWRPKDVVLLEARASARRFIEFVVKAVARLNEDVGLLSREGLVQSRILTVERFRVLGDFHHDGEAVSVLELAAGDVRESVVYKPRPVSLACRVQELLTQCRDLSDLAQCMPRVLGRNGYGWMSYIPFSESVGSDEAEAFYRRFGGLLALVYFLRGTDIHSGNIVATRTAPVLVDFETICGPRLRFPDSSEQGADPYCVIHTGMLPTPRRIGALWERFDRSALLGGRGSKHALDTWGIFVGSGDPARLRRRTRYVEERVNRPTRLGASAIASSFGPIVLQAFRSYYKVLLDEKNALLEIFSSNQAGEDSECRLVFRPTLIYHHLIDEFWHPAILESEDSEQRFLAKRLGRYLPSGTTCREGAEVRAGIVPRYSCGMSSLKAYDSAGAPTPISVASSAITRIANFYQNQAGYSDRDRQCLLINQTIGLHLANERRSSPMRTFCAKRPSAALVISGEVKGALLSLKEIVMNWFGATITPHSFLAVHQSASGSLFHVPGDLGFFEGAGGSVIFLSAARALLGDGAPQGAFDTVVSEIVGNSRQLSKESPRDPLPLAENATVLLLIDYFDSLDKSVERVVSEILQHLHQSLQRGDWGDCRCGRLIYFLRKIDSLIEKMHLSRRYLNIEPTLTKTLANALWDIGFPNEIGELAELSTFDVCGLAVLYSYLDDRHDTQFRNACHYELSKRCAERAGGDRPLGVIFGATKALALDDLTEKIEREAAASTASLSLWSGLPCYLDVQRQMSGSVGASDVVVRRLCAELVANANRVAGDFRSGAALLLVPSLFSGLSGVGYGLCQVLNPRGVPELSLI